MSHLKIKEKIKKNFAIVIVIAIALIVSAPGILLLIYIMQNDLNILIVTAGIIILSIKPVKKTVKKIGFKNLIKINSGKYPAPVEKPTYRNR